MKTKLLHSAGLLACLCLLAACQSVPEEPTTLLSAHREAGRGRVVVRPFYVPSGANLIAGFMAGGTTPFQVTLYDVTASPRYLGTIVSTGVLSSRGQIQPALEYEVEPGPRVVMLHMRKFGGGDFVDFAEVPVAPNEIQHVAISQYGMNDRPYLAKLDFDQKASRHCGFTPGIELRDAAAALKNLGVPESRYAAAYCAALSSATRVRPAAGSAEAPPLSLTHVAELRDKYLPVWRTLGARTPPYDLTQPGQQGM